MRTKRKLVPGQPGTKKLLQQYGEDLVCVRYRYDSARKLRFETVELIVERTDWEEAPRSSLPNRIVFVRIEYGEKELSRRAKEAGARWNRDKKLWELAHKDVVALGLEERIVS